jgi:hypothetical protein
MTLTAPLVAATATTETAGPAVVAVVSLGLILFGLVVILDLGSARTRLVEQRIQQTRDHPRLGKIMSGPTEDGERHVQHRWAIGGGFVSIAFGIAIIWISMG